MIFEKKIAEILDEALVAAWQAGWARPRDIKPFAKKLLQAILSDPKLAAADDMYEACRMIKQFWENDDIEITCRLGFDPIGNVIAALSKADCRNSK